MANIPESCHLENKFMKLNTDPIDQYKKTTKLLKKIYEKIKYGNTNINPMAPRLQAILKLHL
jgi:hypothetical protein